MLNTATYFIPRRFTAIAFALLGMPIYRFRYIFSRLDALRLYALEILPNSSTLD